jgi:hypothetical protein
MDWLARRLKCGSLRLERDWKPAQVSRSRRCLCARCWSSHSYFKLGPHSHCSRRGYEPECIALGLGAAVNRGRSAPQEKPSCSPVTPSARSEPGKHSRTPRSAPSRATPLLLCIDAQDFRLTRSAAAELEARPNMRSPRETLERANV